jgi:P27 family predicted phage terminase small subunit
MRAKSKELKEMQGTYEPSKETESLELTEWTGSRLPVSSPEWPPKIQALWNRRCKDLQRVGHLSEAYLVGLRRYCFAVSMAENAEKMMASEGMVVTEEGSQGNTYQIVSKWLTVLEKANKIIDSYNSKFGFTPADAAKIPAAKKEVKSSEENLLL